MLSIAPLNRMPARSRRGLYLYHIGTTAEVTQPNLSAYHSIAVESKLKDLPISMVPEKKHSPPSQAKDNSMGSFIRSSSQSLLLEDAVHHDGKNNLHIAENAKGG